MGDLMFSSGEIKALANFQPPPTMIDADDSGSHVNVNLFS